MNIYTSPKKLSFLLAIALVCAPAQTVRAEPLSTFLVGLLGYTIATAKAAAVKMKVDFLIKKFNDVVVPYVGTGFIKGTLAGSTPVGAYAYHQYLQTEVAHKAIESFQAQNTTLINSMGTLTQKNNVLAESLEIARAMPFTEHIKTFVQKNPAPAVLIGVTGLALCYAATQHFFGAKKMNIIVDDKRNSEHRSKRHKRNNRNQQAAPSEPSSNTSV